MMTLDEALVFLKVDDESEMLDAIETSIFEIKKQLLAKPLLYKTALSRLQQLQQIHAIEIQFFESSIVSKINEQSGFFKVENEPLKLWQSYQKAKNDWKTVFWSLESASEMIQSIHQGLAIELHYAQQFPLLDWTDERPIFGTETDSMLIEKELQRLASAGVNTFESMFQIKNEIDLSLLLALKRLSLLPKYLQE